MSIYLQLTRQFNDGRLRAILGGGQAVVLHRLAMMSKDGDWLLREDNETMEHVLSVLESYGAVYRFGAPLDIRWLSAGWSAHLEFSLHGMRVRTDFVTRPPRISPDRLDHVWREQEGRDTPFLGAADLIETKKTNREKDYAVIGELARLTTDVADRFRYSRSARELAGLIKLHPGVVASLKDQRPLLALTADDVDALEVALDAERREMIHANERRLACYMSAAEEWVRVWPAVSRSMEGKPLAGSHAVMVEKAQGVLPFSVPGGLL